MTAAFEPCVVCDKLCPRVPGHYHREPAGIRVATMRFDFAVWSARGHAVCGIDHAKSYLADKAVHPTGVEPESGFWYYPGFWRVDLTVRDSRQIGSGSQAVDLFWRDIAFRNLHPVEDPRLDILTLAPLTFRATFEMSPTWMVPDGLVEAEVTHRIAHYKERGQNPNAEFVREDVVRQLTERLESIK